MSEVLREELDHLVGLLQLKPRHWLTDLVIIDLTSPSFHLAAKVKDFSVVTAKAGTNYGSYIIFYVNVYAVFWCVAENSRITGLSLDSEKREVMQKETGFVVVLVASLGTCLIRSFHVGDVKTHLKHELKGFPAVHVNCWRSRINIVFNLWMNSSQAVL